MPLHTFTKDNLVLEIDYDFFADSPRDSDDLTKFNIRKHRRYDFPEEFSFDWENQKEEVKRLSKDYHIFFLDCYEHSGITFSLMWTWMQCAFDTARNCWCIIVPNDVEHNNAREIVESELKQYNQYLNWEIYMFSLYETFPNIEVEWRTYETPMELIDSCGWFYDFDIDIPWSYDFKEELKSIN